MNPRLLMNLNNILPSDKLSKVADNPFLVKENEKYTF